jgi:hypothetical protein
MRRLVATRLAACAVLTFAAAGCGEDDEITEPAIQRTTVSGAGDITSVVTQFRTLLGEPNNAATAGQQAAGRREINWDAVPAARTNTNDFPADFFNVTSTRGAVFAGSGSGFRISDTDFNDVNSTYGAQFNAFSPTKTFAPVGSNVMDVTFRVAGSATVGLVDGFGVVFSDVDRAGSARIEFFDASNQSLGSFTAPVRTDANGLSFIGVKFASRVVARVRITAGEAALGAGVNDTTNGGQYDLVVMDDFFYSEPRP